jgi:hypothetical protein
MQIVNVEILGKTILGLYKVFPINDLREENLRLNQGKVGIT